MKCFFSLLTILIAHSTFAQLDFVTLKKGDRTIARFYKGTPIRIYTTYDMDIDGVVDQCRNDSIFITTQEQRLSANGLRWEKVNVGYIGVALREVAVVPHKRITATAVANTGVKLAILAGCLIGINSINADYKTGYVIGYVSTIAVGYLLSRITIFKHRGPAGYKIGRKFHLEYVKLTGNGNPG
jgi:hypothetical protein